MNIQKQRRKSSLTQRRLKEVFSYNKETGVFIRKIKVSIGTRVGDIAGCRSGGYLSICVDGESYLGSRLAWLYVYGEFPKYNIDHINQNPFDDRIANLRDVTQAENQKNHPIQKNNKSGVPGVSWDKSKNRWRAHIQVNNKSIFLSHIHFVRTRFFNNFNC